MLCVESVVWMSRGDAERLRFPMVNEGGGGDEEEEAEEFKRSARVDIVRESREQAPRQKGKSRKSGVLVSETLREIQIIIKYSINHCAQE